MDPEIIAILAVGVGLAGLILNGQRSLKQEFRQEIASLRQELDALREQVHALSERVARLEVVFQFIAPRLDIPPPRDQTNAP